MDELESNGFRVIEQIGSGGFGNVYKVQWLLYPDKLFVAKLIDIDDEDINKTATYENEIQTLQSINNINIIYIFKYFKLEKYYAIILEYCPNGSLKDYVEANGPLPFDKFLMFASQCLEGLAACHEKGVVHLDIKPANILLCDNYRVKIADFGLAKCCNKNEKINGIGGSEKYFAPERWNNAKFDGMKADIWSLGLTFYYLLTGCYAWKYQSVTDLVMCIKGCDVIFPQEIDYEIVRFVAPMLDKNPQQRPDARYLLKNKVFTDYCGCFITPHKSSYHCSSSNENRCVITGNLSRTSSLQSHYKSPFYFKSVLSPNKVLVKPRIYATRMQIPIK